jgi:hypothetical protein
LKIPSRLGGRENISQCHFGGKNRKWGREKVGKWEEKEETGKIKEETGKKQEEMGSKM